MLVCLPDILSPDAAAEMRDIAEAAAWEDGRATAGVQSALVKDNEQLPVDGAVARDLGRRVIRALTASPLFISAAVPARIFPPLFNRYGAGREFGLHVDNSIRGDPLTEARIRCDLSMTLFLSEPEEYDGGELVVEDTFGAHEVKLPAGQAVLYPSSSLHLVRPVTRGRRVASFTWVQSMIRDAGSRGLVHDLDLTIQDLSARLGNGDPGIVRLANTYHNLIRRWATP